MVLVALGRVFKPMQTFMKDYMGTYVSCMLSSGELPALMSENKLSEINAKCSYSFAGNGASLKGSGGSSSGRNTSGNGSDQDKNGSSKSGNKDGNEKKASNSKDSNGKDKSSDSSGGGGGSGSFAGSASSRSGFGKPMSRSTDRGGEGENGGEGANGKRRYVNNLKTKGDRFYRQKNESFALSRNGNAVAISGFTEEMKKKQERKIQSESKVIAKVEEEGVSRKDRKTVVKPPQAKEKVIKEEEDTYTLGNIFKYAFIAIILLLILILGGGQMFEMSKSYD
ncbi:MAG: hypothetical protein HUU56_07200 [Bdellovibrionaceae bacterium]|nr:hypothetical protein [Pseudobdellovibrionaceae bacterium]